MRFAARDATGWRRSGCRFFRLGHFLSDADEDLIQRRVAPEFRDAEEEGWGGKGVRKKKIMINTHSNKDKNVKHRIVNLYEFALWNLMEFDQVYEAILRDCLMEFDGIWRNSMDFDGIWRNLMESDGIWWNLMEFDGIGGIIGWNLIDLNRMGIF